VFLEKVEGFLLWWSKHKRQFSTIAYLARTILGIPSSHIEIERIYFIASILINLRNCHLDLKNLDLLIKNWLDDPIVGFDAKGGPPKDVDDFGETHEMILDLQDANFFDEVDGCVEECVQNWNMFP
jgi:hypothetical protein